MWVKIYMVLKSMNNNLKVSKKEFKSVIKSKIKTIILVYIIGVVLVLFSSSLHNKVKDDEKAFLYIGASMSISQKANEDLNNIVIKHGLLEFSANTYFPDDMYFEATFHTVGANNTDLFILHKDFINKYADSEIFEEIDTSKFVSDSYTYSFYMYEEKPIGVHFKKDYYVLINSLMENKSRDMYYEMIQYIVLNGGEFNG